ncbi:cytochrome c biogenesis protein CcdA [Dysgonomonas sp. 25]|uniref:protein-disulfide reductase DsbD family protein n=1 Tax=Dysgonomonas sp. 25 TaxID=2302933 RepID=UPI0013CFE5D9|nr:cytochrome c biogenesis protein CcdA [Dysgonomonas sp. 25]NDV70056.1 thiol:disulfide interchange protein [Dysgonomonas sp. 25]
MKRTFLLLVTIISFLGLKADPIGWSFRLDDKGNGEVDFVATVNIDDGWYIYDSEVPDGGPNPTTFAFDEVKGATAVGKVKFDKKNHETHYYKEFSMNIGIFKNQAVFTQRFKVTDKAAFSLKGDVRAQACTDQTCTPPLPFDFEFSAKDLPKTLTVAAVQAKPAEETPKADDTKAANELATTAKEPETTTTTTVTPAPTDTKSDLWTPVIKELNDYGAAGSTKDMTLIYIFFMGMVGGFVALLTPCVWPMIPMTVSFFLKRNKKNKGKAIREAMTYGLGIIIIYVSLGLIITAIFGAGALNDMATSALFNLIFFALLVVFAISFLGAFELTLPSSWTNKMDSKADSTTGIISIFFMAFTLALVSFSCTGPVIGILLVDAASSGSIVAPAIGMSGFAIALAIPFTLFAIFPSWLESMPKSGGWLNSVKVVLGFLELALALKFFSVADMAYGWGLLDREVFLVLWIVIFALLGLYLLGKLKLSHDSDLQYVSVPRVFLAIISFAFAIYMIPGLWGAPLKSISAFLPLPKTQDFSLYDGTVHAKFEDYDLGMAYAKSVNKPVMLDFTGYGCVNCRNMENSVWIEPRVKGMLEDDYVLITLIVDDKTRLPEVIEVTEENGKKTKLKTIGDKWSYLQRHKFGMNSQPYYILLNHEGMPIGPSYAYDKDVSKYINFLQTGLDNFKKQ